VLGHDDIIRLTNHLLQNRPLFRQVVAMRFPFVFIDESQDTMEDVVKSFKEVERQMRGTFCLGFFGDPMQKIYLAGIGNITPEPGWKEIDKPENYRCATAILAVANAVRSAGDELVQVGGRREVVDGEERSVIGTARFFVLPSSMERNKALRLVRRWTAATNGDELWNMDSAEAVKVLVIVHRMAANRLGFLNCDAAEFLPYRNYRDDQSAFATQHGVKGGEFERVMVVLDDAESEFNLYSYEKYFGIAKLSDRDIENVRQGLDNVVSRTRRLLYVCCTRAKRDLALVLLTEDATV